MGKKTPESIELQNASEANKYPKEDDFYLWVTVVLKQTKMEVKPITIRLVDEVESQTLNHQYRGKDKPTNVLSFPSDAPDFIESAPLGDLILCTQVIASEAAQQHKPLQAHYAHMTVHGVLHLLGYDHTNDEQAEEMEALEISILKKLGYANPYQ